MREGYGALGEGGDEGGETVFEGENLEHGHERDTLEELLEAEAADARVGREEVVRERNGGVGEGAGVVRVDKERRRGLEEGHPGGRIACTRAEFEVLDVGEVVDEDVGPAAMMGPRRSLAWTRT